MAKLIFTKFSCSKKS